jgi:hypothetical protein
MISAQMLKHIIQDAGYIPRAYSGRGMFGKECIGFETHDREATMALALDGTADALCDEGEISEDDYDLFFELLTEHLASDDLGKGTIFYFPSIPFTS